MQIHDRSRSGGLGQGKLQAVLNMGADGDSMTCPCIFMLPPAGSISAGHPVAPDCISPFFFLALSFPTRNRIVASCAISIHSSFLTIAEREHLLTRHARLDFVCKLHIGREHGKMNPRPCMPRPLSADRR